VRGLTAGTLSLQIRGADSLPLDVPPRQLGRGEQLELGELVLDDGVAATGRVIDAASRQPIAGARIRLLRPNDFAPTHSLITGDWLEAVADHDGEFSIAGFYPGRWTLLAEAVGHAREVRSVSDSELGTIALRRAQALIVHCTPVPRCGTEARLGSDDWSSVTSPLSDGTAVITPVRPGTHALRLVSDRGVVWQHDVSIGENIDPTELMIHVPSVTVEGRVLIGGEPPRSGTIHFSRAIDHLITIARQSTSGTPFLENLGTWSAEVTAAVADGKFVLSDVAPGSYAVSLDGSKPQTIVVPENVDRFRADVMFPKP